MFFYRQRRTFWTAKGRFFYRCGWWRHAVHDGGDGGDDDEENSFSNGRYHQRHQGEAASRGYGFLCFVITFLILGVVAFAIGLLIFLLR